jgi:hypothetical protein
MRLLTWAGRFFAEMESTLIRQQSRGWTGWGQISTKRLTERLLDNAKRGEWVDVANFALFLWVRKQKGEVNEGD